MNKTNADCTVHTHETKITANSDNVLSTKYDLP